MARALLEQQASSDDLVKAIADVRGRAREIVGGIAQHARVATTMAEEVATVAAEAGRMRQTSVTQAKVVASLGDVLTAIDHDHAGAPLADERS
jgi:hypothetical protein